MKRLAGVIALLVVAAALSAAPDVLQQLSVSKADAGQEILSALASGSPNYHRVRNAFKAASPEARAALVEQVLTWTKAYVNSPQFAQDYAAYREQAKPAPLEEQESVDDELAAQRREHEQQIAEMKKSLASVPAEMRKEMEKAIKETEAAFREMQKDAAIQNAQRENLENERKEAQEQYAADVERWKSEYPADPKVLVKRRVQEFLAATADVDYDAKLVKSGSKMRFANEEYEAKPWEWKLAYRAGKPATEAARAFVKGW